MAWIEQESRERWTATSGNQIIRTWQGPLDEETLFRAATLPDGYSELTRSKTMDDFVTIAATYQAPEGGTSPDEPGLVIRRWELDGGSEQRPIAECDNAVRLTTANASWLAILEVSVSAYKLNLQRALKLAAETSASVPLPEYSTPPRPTITGTYSEAELLDLDDLAEDFTRILRRDESPTFPASVYTLRKTEIVLSVTTLEVSHAYVNRFHRYTTLLGIEPTLPAAILIKPADLRDLYWLKQTPSVAPTNSGQWQLTQEYLGAVGFESFMYGEAL